MGLHTHLQTTVISFNDVSTATRDILCFLHGEATPLDSIPALTILGHWTLSKSDKLVSPYKRL
ncbi:hypothetical protein I7I53_08035 [Histoplasma capsulatum var. duboisii H88]|uniref:Uncharacterized protein n=1 Tax=Ajellomyces capsulatus (strain H88) TaxID=544711 RepID=A0A8A1LFU5_AJEC8|nr:hypothetical protein I7I53_08035 [Histoplasma capsulatum var. duboisii H88]